MISMQQTMRWYGPNDGIKLEDIRQCGATGIVTALHQIPVGDVWTVKDIRERQQLIREAGMEWAVIESLPVHEEIKRASGNYLEYIQSYKESIKNIAACGIKVITYNFMPILDWVRTNHTYENPDGSKALLFQKEAFIYFDVFMLNRPNAKNDFTEKEIKDALNYGNALSESKKKQLFKNVLLGLPGSNDAFTPELILSLLDQYKDIDENKLRENLIYFLSEVAPLAETLGVKLAIHPDDPPFSVLGLPRILSTESDIEKLMKAVPINANGLCYCTGSLGAEPNNDLVQILDNYADRICFLHLRNIIRENESVFRESEHLNGDNPMERIVGKIIEIMNRKGKSIPMRPDHGFLHSFEKTELYPGYSLMGRLKGLAELRGLEKGLQYKLKS